MALLLVAGAFPAPGALAQSAPPRVNGDSLMAHAFRLAADSMEGRLIGSPGNAKARAYLVRKFAEVGLRPLGSSFELPFSAFGRDSSVRNGVNVAGVVRGTQHPDRYIVVTAHYDHVGVRNGQVFNGADDNASGTGAIVELARHFKAHPPANSLVFVAFDGEEGGLTGARQFVASPPVPRDAIVLNVNLDMVGRNDKNELYAAGTSHSPFLRPYLEPVAKRSAITLLFGHDDPAGPRGDDWTTQSDHAAFHSAKIPFIYFGVEDHPDYHRATDDPERLMPAFYARAVDTILDALLGLDRNLTAIIAARDASRR